MLIVNSHSERIFHYKADREKPEVYKEAVESIRVDHKIQEFDIVVDFCAYDVTDIKTSLKALNG